MSDTLNALGGIVLNGLPTFFLVLLLCACVKYLYLNPLEKVLAERYKLTEGARKAAEESLRHADSKVGEYEAALAKARTEIYQEQAEFLRGVYSRQQEEIGKVRAESDAQLAAAKQSIAAEAASVRRELESQSDTLAGQIADSILNRRAA